MDSEAEPSFLSYYIWRLLGNDKKIVLQICFGHENGRYTQQIEFEV
jgi:hypothetical protein